MHRGTKDETVRLHCLFKEGIHTIVDCTLAQLAAGKTGAASGDGVIAYPEDFGLNSFLAQLPGDFHQSSIGIAFFMRTTVDQ